MRVDGTLMGVDTKSASLIPEWKRGHFSLVMDGSAAATTASESGGLAAAVAGASDTTGSEAGAGIAAAAGQGGSANRSGGGEGGSAPRLLFLHHGKQRWVDLGADKKAMKSEEQAALEDQLLAALER